MSAIDQVLSGAIAAGAAPGIVAAVASRDGITYQGAFGRRSTAAPDPIVPDTIFRIYSMTKAVGSIAAARLVEQGKLHLDAAVESIVPAFGELKLLEGFDGDRPILREPRRKATVRQLATHTSGLVYEFWNAKIAKYLEVTGTPSVLSGKRQGLMYPLVFEPGERWDYGIGIDWLGQVIEAVSGKRLDAYCRDEIFSPLAMADTDFECEGARRARLAGVHARAADGSLSAITLDPPSHPEVYGAGYGLYSTARDYMQLLLMLLNEGKWNGAQILRPETVDYMLRNHIGELEVGKLTTVMPAISCDAEFFPGMEKKHSLATMINMTPARGMRAAGSHTWAGALNTFFWLDPASGVAGVILMQLLPFADPKAIDALVAFEKAVYAGRT
jgi:CubicO group peptidase (beta-lactamase class C family)